MLHVFICKSLASRALCEANALAQRLVIGFAIGRVQVLDWEATSIGILARICNDDLDCLLYTYRHQNGWNCMLWVLGEVCRLEV